MLPPSRPGAGEKSDGSSLEIPEEFDSDFYVDNPGVVITRSKHHNEEEPPNVNLPNNNDQKLIKFGLNENKRGKMKESDQIELDQNFNKMKEVDQEMMNKKLFGKKSGNEKFRKKFI